MRKAIVVAGLGFGNEGKGATVDYLARQYGADLVVRYCGGLSSGHTVILNGGTTHKFHQFGSATFQGIRTYHGRHSIVDPIKLLEEAITLETLGIPNPMSLITMHPRCLITTPYLQALGRVQSKAYRVFPCPLRTTRQYWLSHGRDSIFAKDLRNSDVLRLKLELMRQRCQHELQHITDEVLESEDAKFIYNVEPKILASKMTRLECETSPRYYLAIFEATDGVLVDEWYGFKPDAVSANVTFQLALEELRDVEVKTVGVIQTYLTRATPGPFPTRQNENVGFLDLVLLRYGLSVLQPDYVAVNGMDIEMGRVCSHYARNGINRAEMPNLNHQYNLREILSDCGPMLQESSSSETLELINKMAPVAIEAWGPKAADRRSILTI